MAKEEKRGGSMEQGRPAAPEGAFADEREFAADGARVDEASKGPRSEGARPRFWAALGGWLAGAAAFAAMALPLERLPAYDETAIFAGNAADASGSTLFSANWWRPVSDLLFALAVRLGGVEGGGFGAVALALGLAGAAFFAAAIVRAMPDRAKRSAGAMAAAGALPFAALLHPASQEAWSWGAAIADMGLWALGGALACAVSFPRGAARAVAVALLSCAFLLCKELVVFPAALALGFDLARRARRLEDEGAAEDGAEKFRRPWLVDFWGTAGALSGTAAWAAWRIGAHGFLWKFGEHAAALPLGPKGSTSWQHAGMFSEAAQAARAAAGLPSEWASEMIMGATASGPGAWSLALDAAVQYGASLVGPGSRLFPSSTLTAGFSQWGAALWAASLCVPALAWVVSVNLKGKRGCGGDRESRQASPPPNPSSNFSPNPSNSSPKPLSIDADERCAAGAAACALAGCLLFLSLAPLQGQVSGDAHFANRYLPLPALLFWWTAFALFVERGWLRAGTGRNALTALLALALCANLPAAAERASAWKGGNATLWPAVLKENPINPTALSWTLPAALESGKLEEALAACGKALPPLLDRAELKASRAVAVDCMQAAVSAGRRDMALAWSAKWASWGDATPEIFALGAMALPEARCGDARILSSRALESAKGLDRIGKMAPARMRSFEAAEALFAARCGASGH